MNESESALTRDSNIGPIFADALVTRKIGMRTTRIPIQSFTSSFRSSTLQHTRGVSATPR